MNTFKATGIGDVIAAIPAMAGYTPVESLVVLPMSGSTSSGLFRFDLPSLGEDTLSPTYVAMQILGYLARMKGTDGALCVVYSDAPHAAYTHFIDVLAECAKLAGFRSEMAFVCGDGWGNYGEAARAIHTLPVLDIPEAQAAFRSQGQIEEISLLSAVREAEIIEAAPIEVPSLVATVIATAEVMAEADPEHAEARYLGELGVIFATPMLRDVALATWCHGAEAAQSVLTYQIAFARGERDLPAPKSLFLLGEGERPDAQRLLHGLTVARYLAAVKPFTASALTVAAWLSWAVGRTSDALTYANRALEMEPVGLASIVKQMCDTSRLPAWAFQQ